MSPNLDDDKWKPIKEVKENIEKNSVEIKNDLELFDDSNFK